MFTERTGETRSSRLSSPTADRRRRRRCRLASLATETRDTPGTRTDAARSRVTHTERSVNEFRGGGERELRRERF